MAVEPPELWDTTQIAEFYRVSVKNVQNRTIHQPGFPKPIRGAARPKLFIASEVIDFALNRADGRSQQRSRGSTS